MPSTEQSLAAFVVELSRRRPLRFAAHLDGEARRPLPAVLYRIYQAPHTMESRTVLRILKEILRNAEATTLRSDEITALSADMLHLLYYLISDYKESRYSPEEINGGIIWVEGQSGDVGTWGHWRDAGR